MARPRLYLLGKGGTLRQLLLRRGARLHLRPGALLLRAEPTRRGWSVAVGGTPACTHAHDSLHVRVVGRFSKDCGPGDVRLNQYIVYSIKCAMSILRTSTLA